MAEYWLDYSAAKLSGNTIRNAGYAGVVRYIDSPANLRTKHTNLDEYRSHLAAGLKVYLVMQTTTTASDGGYPVGQDHARRALTGANYLGYTGPIFFTNDRTTVPNPAAWQAYLNGAASILGIGRVGAYGFRNAMDLAVGHASFFWQAGRRSDVAGYTHLWQDNNTQVTVGGVLCDRNLVLKPMGEDMLADERGWLADLHMLLVSGIRREFQLNKDLGTVRDEAVAAANAAKAEAQAANAEVAIVDEKLDALAQAVASLQVGGVDVAQLAALLAPAVADVLSKRLAD